MRVPFHSMHLLTLDQAIATGQIESWPYERIAGSLRHLPRPQLLRFSRLLQRGEPVRAALISARTQRRQALEIPCIRRRHEPAAFPATADESRGPRRRPRGQLTPRP